MKSLLPPRLLAVFTSLSFLAACELSGTRSSLPTETVATPTISPDGGTFRSPVTVSLACATPAATIHYTTNGLQATEASAVYTAPLAIDRSLRLSVIAVKEGLANSMGRTATFTFETDTTAIPTIPWNPDVAYGVVEHGNRSYRTVRIGTQNWMAENLADAGSDGTLGSCSQSPPDSCEKYGRVYGWTEILQAPQPGIPPIRGLCPRGWHIPGDPEWMQLFEAIGSTSESAGSPLKSSAGWLSGNGSDSFGFRLLPSGGCGFGKCSGSGTSGSYWTSTPNGRSDAWIRIFTSTPSVARSSVPTQFYNRFSLRCVED